MASRSSMPPGAASVWHRAQGNKLPVLRFRDWTILLGGKAASWSFKARSRS
jgi:hypothetical protein